MLQRHESTLRQAVIMFHLFCALEKKYKQTQLKLSAKVLSAIQKIQTSLPSIGGHLDNVSKSAYNRLISIYST